MDTIMEQGTMWNDANLPMYASLFEDRSCLLHRHNFIELLYISDGTFQVNVNEECFDAVQGDLVFIDLNEPHKTMRRTEKGKILYIHCADSILRDVVTEWFEIRYLSSVKGGRFPFMRCVHIREGDEIQFLFESTIREYTEKALFYELCGKTNVLKIMALYIRHYYNNIEDDREDFSDGLRKIMPVLIHCRKNYMDTLTVTAMAESVYMSESYFCKQFKRVVGKTFVEYVNEIRLNASRQLLILTDESILSIALEVGFGNVTYYNRVFRKAYGLSPGEYRKRSKTNNIV